MIRLKTPKNRWLIVKDPKCGWERKKISKTVSMISPKSSSAPERPSIKDFENSHSSYEWTQ